MNKVVNFQQDYGEQLQLGQCLVLPRENLVVYGEQSVRLEPKVMQVLVVLGENAGKAVSREELIDQAWPGRAITDDAITRCISILRRLFDRQLEVPISIETVSKVGYRLELGEDKKTRAALSGNWLAWTGLAGLVVLAALYFSMTPPQPGRYQLEKLLVSDRPERQAAFSNSGELLAYTIATGPGQRDLYLRELKGDGLSRLSRAPGISHMPVFSPDDTLIAFARVNPEGVCEVRSISVYGGRETRLASCAAGGVSDLEWAADGLSLLYVDRQRHAAAGVLKHIDLESGETIELLDDSLGIDDMALGPDGKSLAITRHRALGVEDLYWRPLDTDEPFRRLTHDNLKIHGIAWAPDSRRIYFSSNRLGPFQLWRIDRDGSELTLVPEALHGADSIAVSPQGVIALERWTERSEIVRKAFATDGSVSVLVTGKGVNWDARWSADGEYLAFVSDRSGSAEIWLKDGNDAFRLSNYQGPWVLSPGWSPVSRHLAYVVPLDGRYQLQLMDVDSQQPSTIDSLPNAFAPAWSADGKAIVVGVESTGEWNLHRVNMQDRSVEQLTSQGGKRGQFDASADWLYYSKGREAGLWRQSSRENSAEVPLTDRLAPVDWNNWQLLGSSLYFVVRSEDAPPALWVMDTETLENTFVTELENLLYFSGINVSPDHDAVVYSRITEEDADINLLYPQ